MGFEGNSLSESENVTIKESGNYNPAFRFRLLTSVLTLAGRSNIMPQIKSLKLEDARNFFVLALTLPGIVILLLTAAVAQTDPGFGGRRLAPGVLTVIPSALNARDTVSLPGPMPGLTATEYTPKLRSPKDTLYGLSQRVVFFRDVWEYEFAFTGLRQATLDIPTANGNARQNVWYLVYRVRNLGNSLSFEEVKKDPDFAYLTKDLRRNETVAQRNFLPRLTLEGWVYDDIAKKYTTVKYRDEIDPAAAAEIQNIEDPNVPLMDAVQLSTATLRPIPAKDNTGAWGVAIWSNVNPKIDFVSVFVSGFTNAFRINRNGDSINTVHKTLQLNFWRPGDAVKQTEDRVDFGIPLVDDPQQQVLITRRYNLPGPMLRVYEQNREINRDVLISEFDAKTNLKDFTSPLVPILDKGRLPSLGAEQISQSGVAVDENTAIEPLIEGRKWTFQKDGKTYLINLEYQFWEPTEEGIRFIKSLDSFWIYR